jgi:glyoxylase-like metal-dependent hydrolase (beta-lactamase superfamily II)
MAETVTVGRATVLAVQDTPISGSRSFMFPRVTDEQWEPWRHYFNPRGNLRMNIGTFVIRSEGRTILVDTGVGDKPGRAFPAGRLPDNLAAAGIRPEEVEIVVNTHLHVDHVGWNTVRREGAWVPAFPRARYVIVRGEWAYWTAPEQAERTEYVRDSVLPLADTGQLDLVEDTHHLTGEVTLVPAPGHTPAHVCVALVSGAERAMIVGDLAHHPVQLTETAWEIVMDLNPALAAETRVRLAARMEQEGGLVLGGHFPPPGIGRLVRLGERRVWQAL